MFRYEVLQTFAAEGPGEVSVSAGELVVSETDVSTEGWIRVRATMSGQEGFVPFAYLKRAQAPQMNTGAAGMGYGAAGAAAQRQQPTGGPATGNYGGASQPQGNPFEMNQMKSSLPAGSGRNLNTQASTRGDKEQYRVIDTKKFDETLELWRERERRFMKGEPERLPPTRERKYFYWDANGNRKGAFTEQEMRELFMNGTINIFTPIAIAIGNRNMPPVPLSTAFPDLDMAFSTVPVIESGNEVFWCYRDDMGRVQGPFSSQQMRDWFQDGYFNAETMVRLAHESDDDFVQLGLLFPEGQGAFLSEGDQQGAKMQQAALMTSLGAASLAAPYGDLGTFSTFEPMPTYTHQPPSPNPFETTAAYKPYDLASDMNYDSNSGKGLFVQALATNAYDSPPPALGKTNNAAPAALAPPPATDWGIVWDDETPDEAIVNEETGEQVQLVAQDEEDDDHHVIEFDELEKRYLNSVDSLYIFLTRSLPKNLGTVQCKIKRSIVGLHMNYNLYELYLERDDSTLGPQILIAQKHRKYGVDSYYNIAIGSVNSKESGKVISCVNFNTAGTNFVTHNNVAAHKGSPRDLACVLYQRNIGKGPRKFQVAIPALRPGSETEQVDWPHQGSVRKSQMLKSLVSMDFNNLQPLVNKKPTWSKKHKAWVLNFHGRVTRSSVKNFQLVRPDEDKSVVLQFGRVGTDTFTMDMSWPISPAAAFAICVSSLHSKLMVE